MVIDRPNEFRISSDDGQLLWIGVDCWEMTLRGLRIDAKKAGDSERVATLDHEIARCRNLKRRLLRAGPRTNSSDTAHGGLT